MALDPFSAVAAALQVASLAGELLTSITRFVDQTRSIVDTIQDLYDEIRHLKGALDALGEAFSKQRQKHPFECRHHDRIHSILKSCHDSLENLSTALPELKDHTTPIQKLRLSILKLLKEQRLKEIVHHVTSYTRILDLSLSTVSLGELWTNRESQDMILAEVRKIRRQIRTTDVISECTEIRGGNAQHPGMLSGQQDSAVHDEEVGSVLCDEIQSWLDTVEYVAPGFLVLNTEPAGRNCPNHAFLSVARVRYKRNLLINGSEVTTAMSLSMPDSGPTDWRPTVATHSASNSTTALTPDDDSSDSESEETDELSREIMQHTLKCNQNNVAQLLQCEIYSQAAEFQRRGIGICGRLNELSSAQSEESGRAANIYELADMREKLVDILFLCDTTPARREAGQLLRELLDENKESQTEDDDRQWRLYHKFGRLYLVEANYRKARGFLNKAFRGRAKATPRNYGFIFESANLLIDCLQALQLFDVAQGIQCVLERLQAECGDDDGPRPDPSPRPSVSPNYDLSAAYRWCIEQGFDVDSPQFGFDVCDPRQQTTPICRTIELQNIEILRSMLSNVPHVEQEDGSEIAPVHLAAATLNEEICALLLEKVARVNIVDKNRKTPLHKCQSGSGGIRVAELILERCPSLIDSVDCFGKTALYMACQAGNEEMARVLLSRGATPNTPGQSLPLVGAIDAIAHSTATIRLVQLLLESGADTKLRERNGRTAREAADNAGLNAGEIKRLLSENVWRRSSTSTVGTVDSIRTSSTGSHRSVAGWSRLQATIRRQG